MNRLKEKWNINSNLQLAIILIVFSITGSLSAKLGEPLTNFVGIERANPWLYWPVRIFIIFPIYQVLIVIIGWLFGQYQFFWEFEKKMLRRMGFKLLLKE